MFGIDDLIVGGLNAAGSFFATQQNNQAAMDRQNAANQFNAQQAQIQRDWSAGQAQNQMAFQRDMSSTAYQRAAQDMRAAGLNPILAAGNASSSPGGAMGSGSAATGVAAQSSGSGLGEALTKGLSSAQQNKQMNTAIDLQRQEILKRTYEMQNLDESNKKIKADTDLTKVQASNASKEGKIKDQLLEVAISDALKAKTTAEFDKSPGGKILRMIGLGGREMQGATGAVGDVVSSALGVKRLRPQRSTEETTVNKHGGGSSTFKERFNF